MKSTKIVRRTGKTKPWIKHCFIASGVLLAIAASLYIFQCVSLNTEFGYAADYHGESFDELYRLTVAERNVSKELLTQAEGAFSFIGTAQEAEKTFGKLSRYSTETDDYPEAVSVEYTLDLIAGNTGEDEGYLWVAYTYRCYDAGGELVSASGTKEERCLARWTIEKIEESWQVTDIEEHP